MNRAEMTVKSMAAFLEPLKRNTVASEAILQLLRLVLAGNQITLRVLDQVGRVLEKERARP